MSFFSVKNYEQFQHYKDRSPPWIKFYNSVLDDYEFTRLPDASRSHLVAIWLLASRTNNRIPYDPEWVRMAIKATTKVDLGLLEKAGFIVREQPCSETLATCEQNARPERETEKRQSREEREEEKKAPDGAQSIAAPLIAILGNELAEGVIDHRKKIKKPLTALAAKLLAGKFETCPDPPAAAQAMIANGWQGIDPSWMKRNDKPSDLQRRTSLAREFLTVPVGGTETSGAGSDQAPAGEAFSGMPHGTSGRH
jgi:ribosomal protein L12E/L44/L45/RPP1/RPP2